MIEGIEERDKLDHASKAQKVLRMPEGLAAIGKGQPLLRTDIVSPCRDPDFFFKGKKKPLGFLVKFPSLKILIRNPIPIRKP